MTPEEEVDFEIWKKFFELALDGSAAALNSAAAIVSLADTIAQLALKKQKERRGT
jgi:hypothetical protein